MHDVTRALTKLIDQNQDWEKEPLISFAEFLQEATSRPTQADHDYQEYLSALR